ncbi:hypothetical protein LWI29_023689 [Acer saccharum]|uniref:Uncharacterized protein n=1 Tax=Acer saccharum TaxID=4024 RepID=A0AA39W8Q8_ACESA|nr:hypothetical protein LWI29_023689 [Acer saccharum]
MKSDAALVVELLDSGYVPVLEIGLVINDIVPFLESSYVLGVKFVPRVAHLLAKLALSYGTRIPNKYFTKDLLTDVPAHVVSSSITDLFNVELSCKDLLDVGNYDYIFQHACIDNFPIAPWPIIDEASSFLKTMQREQQCQGSVQTRHV